MKKHNMPLSYKDLHAIKHALQITIQIKKGKLSFNNHFPDMASTLEYNNEQIKKDIEHDTNLLLRVSERIDEIKDKYKIGG
jgi:hypothetical protein